LGLEIDQQFLVEEFAVLKRQFILDSLMFPILLHYRSSGDTLHHSRLNNHQVMGVVFVNGGNLNVLKTENKFFGLMKQFDYAYLSVGLNQSVEQNAEL
jgi:hypothetical protein